MCGESLNLFVAEALAGARARTPREHPEVKVEGDKVVAYPELRQFSMVTFKVLRYRIVKDKLVITEVETVAQAA